MRVLIIEDERKAARELQFLILSLRPEWTIVDILPSAGDAIKWLDANKPPDLLFSDIQLADADCFQIFKKVKVTCPVIFCTAYDEYAIRAFETNSIDYLLKPVDRTRLEKSLSKLDTLRSALTTPQPSPGLDIAALIDSLKAPIPKTILVHHKEKIIPISYSDIAFFYYSQGTVTIRLDSGPSYHITQPIDEIEAASDPRLFYRANRQFLINRHSIRSIEKFFARKLVVRLNVETPETLVVSKAKAGDFLSWLEKGTSR
ncbi:MAG: response regulator transcription factor [Bacteroidetes bacterium]|nr:response regulator transcription factor [Bacteroidota bacterium]